MKTNLHKGKYFIQQGESTDSFEVAQKILGEDIDRLEIIMKKIEASGCNISNNQYEKLHGLAKSFLAGFDQKLMTSDGQP